MPPPPPPPPPPQHPAQQNWCFDYEYNAKLHRMTTQTVRKKISNALHFKLTLLINDFTSYMALQCMTLKYRHKNSMHAHNGAPGSPIGQKCHPPPPQHPAQQNWCFDYEYNAKLHRMTTQTVRKKISNALHFKLTLLINDFTSYIKKCQTGTYFFGWVYIQVTCMLHSYLSHLDSAIFVLIIVFHHVLHATAQT